MNSTFRAIPVIKYGETRWQTQRYVKRFFGWRWEYVGEDYTEEQAQTRLNKLAVIDESRELRPQSATNGEGDVPSR